MPLQRHRGTLRAVIPPAQNVASAVVSVVGERARIGSVERRDRQGFSIVAAINIAWQGQGIGACRCPIRAEPSAQRVPTVMRGHARRILRWSPIEILSVSSVGGIADLAAVASPTGAALFGARSCGHNSGLRVFGLLADDVDYAVHGIGAPQSRARASDHFNPVDILEHYVLHIPVDARK